MEIVQERLDREFDMNVITTVPNVSYNIYDKQGNMTEVHKMCIRDRYQQRYECFLRIMDYFFCFCNKEYVFLNH